MSFDLRKVGWVLVICAVCWAEVAGAANARNPRVTPKTNPALPLKTYEIRINTQMEWLVLEQLKLGAQPTHFLKFRRGNRTQALSVITKADFDRWTADIMAVRSPRQPACAHPFEARAFVGGVKYLNRFCPGMTSDPAVRNLSKSTSEMLSYLRRHDALKGASK